MKNISLANNPFAKTPSTKLSVSQNKKVDSSLFQVGKSNFSFPASR
jgi:hypothetical protein